MPFRFKQFVVDDSACAMKLGTDSVLLGAWARFENSSKILDIGTGCGVLALMSAQRSEALITAIDIDRSSIEEASCNFEASLWGSRLQAEHISLQEYASIKPEAPFDHILSNPPYFINSLKAPDKQRSRARHNDQLPFDELADAVTRLLSEDGKFSLILPVNEASRFIEIAGKHELSLTLRSDVVPVEGKIPNRVLMEFGKEKGSIVLQTFTIRKSDSSYTDEYKFITNDFYLNF